MRGWETKSQAILPGKSRRRQWMVRNLCSSGYGAVRTLHSNNTRDSGPERVTTYRWMLKTLERR